MRLSVMLIAVTVLLHSGCSFVLLRPPAEQAKAEPPLTAVQRKSDCTESVAAPALDVTGAVLLSTLSVLSFVLAGTNGDPVNGALLVPGIIVGALSLALATTMVFSGVYGFKTTAQCRALNRPPIALPETPMLPPGAACVQRGDAPVRCVQPALFTSFP